MICSVDGCERDFHANGLCLMHYRRQRRTGKVGDAKPNAKIAIGKSSKCSWVDCDELIHSRGFCSPHYAKARRDGLLSNSKPCSIDRCTKAATTKGMCKSHYERIERTGSVEYQKEMHGMEGTNIYRVWGAMIQRSTNPNHKSYKNYGGRGIKVCDRWRNSFSAFHSDMGDRPFDSASIDRIDNDGDYCPENCQWSTSKSQANNRRDQMYARESERNQSGTIGVWEDKSRGKWKAYFRKKTLGWFDTEEEAISARNKAEKEDSIAMARGL